MLRCWWVVSADSGLATMNRMAANVPAVSVDRAGAESCSSGRVAAARRAFAASLSGLPATDQQVWQNPPGRLDGRSLHFQQRVELIAASTPAQQGIQPTG